jgi:hypothetical protein
MLSRAQSHEQKGYESTRYQSWQGAGRRVQVGHASRDQLPHLRFSFSHRDLLWWASTNGIVMVIYLTSRGRYYPTISMWDAFSHTANGPVADCELTSLMLPLWLVSRSIGPRAIAADFQRAHPSSTVLMAMPMLISDPISPLCYGHDHRR